LGTAEGDVVHPTECMPQLLEQVRHHKANIDCNDYIVMVTTLVLEVEDLSTQQVNDKLLEAVQP